MIRLERTPLQELRVDALAFGAKDTGEMGGGAAAAIIAATGPEIVDAARVELAKTTRQIGEAVITRAFGLEKRGVKWIVHILSIIKHTPEGAWCPKPEKLRDGVRKGLELAAAKGATSIALSMLGTGEGRVTYADAARLMVAGVKDFRRGFTGEMEIVFSLTNARGYDAVRDHLAARL